MGEAKVMAIALMTQKLCMHVVFTEFTLNSHGVGSNFALWYAKTSYDILKVRSRVP